MGKHDGLVARLRFVGYLNGDNGDWGRRNPDGREAAQAIIDLEARVAELEAALRFYGREQSWKSSGVYMSGRSQPSAAELDRGDRARKALGGGA